VDRGSWETPRAFFICSAPVIDITETKAHIKRVYVKLSEDDGRRILVDRLWPRGPDEGESQGGSLVKEIAPSNELHKWFGHAPKKWPEFKWKYAEELKTLGGPLGLLRQEASRETITLLYGARDEEHNEAIILLELLQKND
jgi:uncharacterized protein YeaO (DUF488 family)